LKLAPSIIVSSKTINDGVNTGRRGKDDELKNMVVSQDSFVQSVIVEEDFSVFNTDSSMAKEHDKVRGWTQSGSRAAGKKQ